MADNTILNLGTGGDTIATDDLTTLNGGVVSGVKAQRTKVGWGADASFRDVSGVYPLPITLNGDHNVSNEGRTSTFRIPGRAGTTGQKLLSIHNATSSTIVVDVNSIQVHHTETVIKAVTILPPIIRVYKVTVLPTNGTACVKVAKDSSQSSSSSVTILQDASADGTSSTTALTATLTTSIISSVFADRLITAVGSDKFTLIDFFNGNDQYQTLRALEGIVVMLDYTLATQNPTTDMWIVNLDWVEYTEVA
tara:strand:- start:229 stop:981 length:753 start_codon:yes stop_codon:yes gene_type:complete